MGMSIIINASIYNGNTGPRVTTRAKAGPLKPPSRPASDVIDCYMIHFHKFAGGKLSAWSTCTQRDILLHVPQLTLFLVVGELILCVR